MKLVSNLTIIIPGIVSLFPSVSRFVDPWSEEGHNSTCFPWLKVLVAGEGFLPESGGDKKRKRRSLGTSLGVIQRSTTGMLVKYTHHKNWELFSMALYYSFGCVLPNTEKYLARTNPRMALNGCKDLLEPTKNLIYFIRKWALMGLISSYYLRALVMRLWMARTNRHKLKD